MKFTQTKISDVILVEVPKYVDKRGCLIETYHETIYYDNNIREKFIQDNQVFSKKDTLRGLHYQLKYPQGKLVRCIQGTILDIAVDIRRSSNTFGKWVSAKLSAENLKQLYIPPGFAHGYLVLSDIAEVIYKCTELYHPEDEHGILWNDADIGIDWKIKKPILSDKDKLLPLLKDVNNKLFN